MFTVDQPNIAFGNAKLTRKKPDQVCVGGAIDRGGSDAQLETMPVDAGEFIATGAGLDAQVQDEYIALPAVPGRIMPGHGRSSQKILSIILSKAINRKIANIGEKSNPEMGGSSRLIGRKTGSLTLTARPAAGF